MVREDVAPCGVRRRGVGALRRGFFWEPDFLGMPSCYTAGMSEVEIYALDKTTPNGDNFRGELETPSGHRVHAFGPHVRGTEIRTRRKLAGYLQEQDAARLRSRAQRRATAAAHALRDTPEPTRKERRAARKAARGRA